MTHIQICQRTKNFLVDEFCGSRLQPRNQNTQKDWALAPEALECPAPSGIY
jgi:hypothetical protein